MASHQVWKKESPAEEERMCNTFCVMKQTEHGERVGGRDESSHERTQETELQGIVDGLARNPREAVKKFEE